MDYYGDEGENLEDVEAIGDDNKVIVYIYTGCPKIMRKKVEESFNS